MGEVNNLDDKEKIFDEAFKNQGGLLKLKENEVVLAQILTIVRMRLDLLRAIKPYLPECYIAYIDNANINAVATCYKGHYLIGINYGTCYVLNFIFDRMLCSKNILVKFGNVANEVDLPKLYNAQITGLFELDAALDRRNIRKPKDRVRESIASFLLFEAMTGLVFHEYGHISGGHCDYLNTVAKQFSFSEDGNEKSNALTNLDYQTLEMDADCFSTTNMLFLAHRFIHHQVYPENLIPYLKNIPDYTHLYVFSIYTLWRLFGQKPYDLSNLKNAKHPPAFLRQMIFISVIGTIYQGEAYQKKITANNADAVHEVEKAFAAVSELGMQVDENFFKRGTLAEKHLNHIMENWNVLRDKLVPFAKSKIAPPNNFNV